jgi:glycosyltransferase involved in cell wall biosynthesis
MKRTVVIDATPLLGSSGHRGIGRVVYDLLHGLEELRSEWDDLDLRVVTELGLRRGPVTDRLGEAAEQLFANKGTQGRALMRKRRFALDGTAADAGAQLLHVTEAFGTPLTHRVPRLITVHDLIPLRMPREYLQPGPERWIRKSVDLRRYTAGTRLVAISQRTRNDVIELLKIPEDRIEVVPNGIDLSFWSSEAAPTDPERLHSLGITRPYVVYAGYWDHRKDVPTMLRAVAAARKSIDVEMVWAGQFSERDQRRLRSYLRSEGLEDELPRVRFPGFVSAPDLAVLYRHAVAHMFVSRVEGFGISVAEAMSCGCPAIVARGSGADEVGGDAVITIEPGDYPAAARAIVELQGGKHEALRARGLERVREFSRVEMARGYLAAYRRALEPDA